MEASNRIMIRSLRRDRCQSRIVVDHSTLSTPRRNQCQPSKAAREASWKKAKARANVGLTETWALASATKTLQAIAARASDLANTINIQKSWRKSTNITTEWVAKAVGHQSQRRAEKMTTTVSWSRSRSPIDRPSMIRVIRTCITVLRARNSLTSRSKSAALRNYRRSSANIRILTLDRITNKPLFWNHLNTPTSCSLKSDRYIPKPKVATQQSRNTHAVVEKPCKIKRVLPTRTQRISICTEDENMIRRNQQASKAFDIN